MYKGEKMDILSSCNDKAWGFLADSLSPPSSNIARFSGKWCVSVVTQVVKTGISIPVVLATSLLALIEKVCNATTSLFCKKTTVDPNKNFSAVLKDSREWDKIHNIRDKVIASPPGDHRKDFLYGTASCTYQDSGFFHAPNSQWASWEKKTVPANNQSNKSANLFELYQTNPQEVIERLRKLNVNSYRTSVEWSHLEPQPGVFDETKLQVYVNFCKELVKAGIEPMITLHHFSEPQWFHDKGSFEKEENIADFVRFSEKVYTALTENYQGRPLVKHFCTINEPAIEAFSRFVRGAYSPGVTFDFHRAAHFLKGALKAHFAVYKALKNLPAKDTKIGFTHQYLHFLPGNPLVTPATKYLTALINDTTLNLFKTGTFSLQVPLRCNVVEQFSSNDIQADFIGVQYYTRPYITLTGCTTTHAQEAMTSMPFREDPAGLYEAVSNTHKATKRPIIVTENGISTHDPAQRNRYMERALYALKQAEKDLGPEALLGYYQWCIVDNFEWDLGMKPQAFGAYSLTTDAQGNPKISEQPKPGTEAFREVAQAWQQSVAPQEQVAG